MDIKKHLDYLFDEDYIDEEQNAYFIQKEALLKGIKFSPLNGSLINYHKSNQLADSESKSFYYLLQHAFYINTLPNIRNKLAKIIIFPNEVFKITVFYKNQKIMEKQHIFKDENSLKINFQNLCEITSVINYEIKELCFEVQLIQSSFERIQAEEMEYIYDSKSAINNLYNYLREQLEVLSVMNKNHLLDERIKLWGYDKFHMEQLNIIGRPCFIVKNVYDLGLISYLFLNEVTNEELFQKNEYHLSYLNKMNKLSQQLQEKDILWIGL